MNTMKYKGYIAHIEYSELDEEFFGTVINTSHDRISFGGTTVEELKKHMQEAIEGHIENCRTLNIEPEKPYSGRITLRMDAEEHALLVEAAMRAKMRSLNEWMRTVLKHAAKRTVSQNPDHHY